jgi:hypothetical protein
MVVDGCIYIGSMCLGEKIEIGFEELWLGIACMI